MFHAAIFDWDGVIINSASQHKLSWETLAKDENLPLPSDFFERSFGSKNNFIIPHILCWTHEPSEIQRLSSRKEEIYRQIIQSSPPEVIPGIKEFLNALESHSVLSAIASSTERQNILSILEKINLNHPFQAIIAAEDVIIGKPDPEVFLKAAEALKCDPQHCIVFEDSPLGIKAGLTAHMKTIGISTTHPNQELGDAHMIIDSFHSLSLEDLERIQSIHI